MRTALPADERPARNVLIVGVAYATNTQKRAAGAKLFSANLVCPSIKPSTPNPLQRNADENAELPDFSLLGGMESHRLVFLCSIFCFSRISLHARQSLSILPAWAVSI